ncbi:hypothetical protein PtA15_10A563 [Puccinia triticina]|uniref:Uncharacterized protein n=1 Tax=Puccinia triticina TaxID=208348 RepID=A0ABY7CWX7_9BASI|nr:uncharacterized protein PtA15_10A563 [Puccinia triticina]WAQ89139.1 hypothetical protein PtA15_10A563 [Puccinia triticina]WAR59195.1 hypothetical protein PtB15_10B537 [Puccinia triticina]
MKPALETVLQLDEALVAGRVEPEQAHGTRRTHRQRSGTDSALIDTVWLLHVSRDQDREGAHKAGDHFPAPSVDRPRTKQQLITQHLFKTYEIVLPVHAQSPDKMDHHRISPSPEVTGEHALLLIKSPALRSPLLAVVRRRSPRAMLQT